MEKKQQKWYGFILEPFYEQLKLREIFTSARKAQLNEFLRYEDQPKIKGTLFLSTFLIFNCSLLSFYLVSKTPKDKRGIVLPAIMIGFSVISYKLFFEWMNNEMLRWLQTDQSQTSYYFRNKLLNDPEPLQIISSRRPLLEKINSHYQQLYIHDL